MKINHTSYDGDDNPLIQPIRSKCQQQSHYDDKESTFITNYFIECF